MSVSHSCSLWGSMVYAGLAQLAERVICNLEVKGSSPLSSSTSLAKGLVSGLPWAGSTASVTLSVTTNSCRCVVMSLHIYFDWVDDLPAIPFERDVERLFSKVALTGFDYDKSVLEHIEFGSYKDKSTFIDRFGIKVRVVDLSTCDKAAMSLHYYPDVLICGDEIR